MMSLRASVDRCRLGFTVSDEGSGAAVYCSDILNVPLFPSAREGDVRGGVGLMSVGEE